MLSGTSLKGELFFDSVEIRVEVNGLVVSDITAIKPFCSTPWTPSAGQSVAVRYGSDLFSPTYDLFSFEFVVATSAPTPKPTPAPTASPTPIPPTLSMRPQAIPTPLPTPNPTEMDSTLPTPSRTTVFDRSTTVSQTTNQLKATTTLHQSSTSTKLLVDSPLSSSTDLTLILGIAFGISLFFCIVFAIVAVLSRRKKNSIEKKDIPLKDEFTSARNDSDYVKGPFEPVIYSSTGLAQQFPVSSHYEEMEMNRQRDAGLGPDYVQLSLKD